MWAVFTVTSLNDAPVAAANDAQGTLRQAIFDAEAAPGADSIQFAAALSGAIDLTVVGDSASGQSAFAITSQITIQGNPNGITIRRGASAPEMRLFRVDASGDLALDSIMVAGGRVHGTNGVEPGTNGGDVAGGAILNQGTLSILACTLYDNSAIGGDAGAGGTGGAARGGAIYNDAGSVVIGQSTLSNHSVVSGAGASTTSFGGTIYGRNGSIMIHNSTITAFTAPVGRGVYVLAEDGLVTTADVRSSIIAQHDAPSQFLDFNATWDPLGTAIVTGANNLIRRQNGFNEITVSSDNPLLGPLANHGGPTLTHALLADSPAINSGDNSAGATNDQRGAGYPRVVGVKADIGAFEVQSVIPELLGDYNTNHFVDAADFVLWRATINSTGSSYFGADGSGNGIIDDADFGVWRTYFGARSIPLSLTANNVPVSAAAMEVQVETSYGPGNHIISMPANFIIRQGRIAPLLVLLDPDSSDRNASVDEGAPTSILGDTNLGPELADAVMDDVRTHWPRLLFEE